MNALKSLWIAATVVAVVFCAGCQQDEQLPAPEFELERNLVQVTAEGGSAEILYTLENAVEGEDVVALAEEGCTWLSGFNTSGGKITFVVEPFASEGEREATVNVTYCDIERSFKVVQFAGETILDLGQDNMDIPAEGGTFSVRYELETTVLDADFSFSVDEWVSGITVESGEISFVVSGNPETAARTTVLKVTYAGVSDEMTLVQAAKEPELTFTVNLIEEPYASNSVALRIEPSFPDAMWIGANRDKSSFAGNLDDQEKLFEELISSYKSSAESYGMTLEEYLLWYEETYGMLQGEMTVYFMYLVPGADYYMLLGGIDMKGEPTSDVFVYEFSTKEVPIKEMGFEIIPHISGKDVMLSIRPSDSTRYWYFTCCTREDFDDLGKEMEIWMGSELQSSIRYYGYEGYSAEDAVAFLCYKGKKTLKLRDNYIDPNTEYIVGIVAVDMVGNVTSSAKTLNFTTGDGNVSGPVVILEYDEYYDGAELEELNPDDWKGATGGAIFPVTVKRVDASPVGAYICAYNGNLLSADEYSDELLIYNLKTNGGEDIAISATKFYLLSYDKDLTIVAAGYDEEGNFGPVARVLVNCSREGVSPIDDFKRTEMPVRMDARVFERVFNVDALEQVEVLEQRSFPPVVPIPEGCMPMYEPGK